MKIKLPLNNDVIKELKSGMLVEVSGTLYTARDAAHNLLVDALNNKEDIPFDLNNACIFYVGPTPAKKDQVIGSVGPTSSYRMDDFMEVLFQNGLKGTIGKGPRSESCRDLHSIHTAVYFSAVGGTAALLNKHIVSSEVIAYPELGTEAIRKLEVKDFPVIVTYDSYGNDAYKK